MNQLVDKIFLWTKKEIIKNILDKYKQQWFCVINFIYYASLSKYVKSAKDNYYKALLNWEFLLPDGIALKLYLKRKFKKKLKENLNGTDFTPHFLNNLDESYHLAFYTVYDEKIWKKASDTDIVEKYIKENFKPSWIYKAISHYNQRWKWFDFNEYKKSFSDKNYDYKIFLVWIGSPFQEIWTYDNIDFFKENNIIVLNVGWLFDFWSWFEKRAPKLIRKLNLEWLWRLWQNPKKNWNKVKESLKVLLDLI